MGGAKGGCAYAYFWAWGWRFAGMRDPLALHIATAAPLTHMFSPTGGGGGPACICP